MTDQDKLYAVVDALLDMGAVAASVIEEGSVTMADVPKLTGLLPELLPALADLGSVPAAVKSMSPKDAEDLIAHVVAKLSFSNAKATAIADAALSTASSLVGLYTALKA